MWKNPKSYLKFGTGKVKCCTGWGKRSKPLTEYKLLLALELEYATCVKCNWHQGSKYDWLIVLKRNLFFDRSWNLQFSTDLDEHTKTVPQVLRITKPGKKAFLLFGCNHLKQFGEVETFLHALNVIGAWVRTPNCAACEEGTIALL